MSRLAIYFFYFPISLFFYVLSQRQILPHIWRRILHMKVIRLPIRQRTGLNFNHLLVPKLKDRRQRFDGSQLMPKPRKRQYWLVGPLKTCGSRSPISYSIYWVIKAALKGCGKRSCSKSRPPFYARKIGAQIRKS